MFFALWLLLFLVSPAATVAPVATSAALLTMLVLPSVVVPVPSVSFPFPISISFALTFYLNRRRFSSFVPFVFTLGTVRSGTFLLTTAAAAPASGLLFGHFICKVYTILNVYEKKNNAIGWQLWPVVNSCSWLIDSCTRHARYRM